MDMTLSGIVTLVRLVPKKNALLPMLATGRPVMVLGMITSPPAPVYPVMVRAPLLVVYWNSSACMAAGSAPRSRSASRHIAMACGPVVPPHDGPGRGRRSWRAALRISPGSSVHGFRSSRGLLAFGIPSLSEMNDVFTGFEQILAERMPRTG